MTTILFIHGTGNRDPRAQVMFQRIRDGFTDARSDIRVERCYWGDPLGARRKNDYLSIYFADGSIPDGAEQDVALWGQLLIDPLFEIRLRPAARPRDDDYFGETLRDQIMAMTGDAEVAAKLGATGLIRAELVAAATQVTRSREYREVYEDAYRADGVTVGVLSRAVVACCLRAAAERGVELTGQARDELVTIVGAKAFGPAPDAGLADPFVDLARRTAHRTVTEPMVRARRVKAIESMGDILVYQARGSAIRAFIRDAIAAADDQVVLLAHSLGGIIAFDLLAEPRARTQEDPLDKVRMLITVGSQVPLFYELGALASGISEPARLPDYFPARWVNVYDKHDLLAYAGRGLFGDRCKDKPVDTGTPFPTAHSAYWADPALFQFMQAEMKDAGL